MKYTLYILSVFVLLASCDKQIEIELGAAEHMLVVNSVINPDSLIKVNLTRNRHILDNADIPNVEPPKYKAVVKLFAEGTYLEDLEFLANGDYISTIKPQIGVDYSLEIEESKLAVVKASSIIPEPIEIIKVDTLTINGSDEYYYGNAGLFECKITFKDPPQEDNYYMIRFAADISYMQWRDTSYTVVDSVFANGKWIYDFREVTSYEKYARYMDNNIYYMSDDISSEFQVGNSYVFSDMLFNGQTYSFTAAISEYNLYSLDSVVLYASLLNLSEDYYKYLKTRSLHYDSKNDFFTTPVTVYNNIEGGVGILGSYTASETSISVKRTDPWGYYYEDEYSFKE